MVCCAEVGAREIEAYLVDPDPAEQMSGKGVAQRDVAQAEEIAVAQPESRILPVVGVGTGGKTRIGGALTGVDPLFGIVGPAFERPFGDVAGAVLEGVVPGIHHAYGAMGGLRSRRF